MRPDSSRGGRPPASSGLRWGKAALAVLAAASGAGCRADMLGHWTIARWTLEPPTLTGGSQEDAGFLELTDHDGEQPGTQLFRYVYLGDEGFAPAVRPVAEPFFWDDGWRQAEVDAVMTIGQVSFQAQFELLSATEAVVESDAATFAQDPSGMGAVRLELQR